MATVQVTQPKFSFNARSAKYHPKNAYWLSVCSDLSYNSVKTIRQTIMDRWKLDRFNFISRKDSQCFITSNKKIIIISFRGTEKDEVGDILCDLDMSQSNAYGGKVHRGFVDAYRQLKSSLMAKIKEHRTHNQPIWLTGHSLGGALAMIAAMDLSEKKLNVKGVYTFGQPRVGDAEFTRLYDRRFRGKSFRFVNKDDQVPELPPAKVKLGHRAYLHYTHGDQVIYIASRNRMTLNYRRSKNILNQIESISNAAPSHASDSYVKALLKNIDYNPMTSNPKPIKEKDLVNLKNVEKEFNGVVKGVDRETKKASKSINKAATAIMSLF